MASVTLAAMAGAQRPATSAISVETVSDYSAFLKLEPVWNQLVEAAEIEHPFLEHAWVRTWWESFGSGSTLNVLVLKADGEPIAIAPLILTSTRMFGIKIRRLGFFYNSHVPRADFIIASRRKDVYRAIWKHLSENRGWDLLQLCQLPEESETLEEISKLAAEHCRIGVWPSGASPYLPLRTSWARYFATLDAKHRGNLRNRLKRLQEMGPVEMETITSGEPESLQNGFQLEAAAWKGEARTAISSDPDVSKFYLTLAQRAAHRGWMRLHFLNAGSQRVAFDYSLVYKDRIHLLKVGYDPAYARFSPFNLLLQMVLQSAFTRGLAEYDFLGEIAHWKLNWTKLSRPHYWLFVFSGNHKGRLLHRIKFQLVPWLKQLQLAARSKMGRS